MHNLKDNPLYSFYEAIKEHDQSLGHRAIDFISYQRLLEVIGDGRGLLSKAGLYFICRTLLLKPYHEEAEFRRRFKAYLNTFVAKQKTPEKPIKKDKEQTGQPEISKGEKSIEDEDWEEDDSPVSFDPEDELEEEDAEEAEYEPTTKVRIQFGKSMKAGKIESPTPTEIKTLEQNIYEQSFFLSGKYLPFSSRKLEQGIKSLRRFELRTSKQELDLTATIERVSAQGYLDRVVLKYVEEAVTPLTILLDWGGSMVAFHKMAEELIQATYDRHKKVGHRVYYFHDYPSENVYRDQRRIRPVPVELLKKENEHAFLIFSDGGAARGSYSEGRVKATQQFLEMIKHRPCAWLNPMPTQRWAYSSAGEIADSIEMFDFTMNGFSRAMRWLKSVKSG